MGLSVECTWLDTFGGSGEILFCNKCFTRAVIFDMHSWLFSSSISTVSSLTSYDSSCVRTKKKSILRKNNGHALLLFFNALNPSLNNYFQAVASEVIFFNWNNTKIWSTYANFTETKCSTISFWDYYGTADLWRNDSFRLKTEPLLARSLVIEVPKSSFLQKCCKMLIR